MATQNPVPTVPQTPNSTASASKMNIPQPDANGVVNSTQKQWDSAYAYANDSQKAMMDNLMKQGKINISGGSTSATPTNPKDMTTKGITAGQPATTSTSAAPTFSASTVFENYQKGDQATKDNIIKAGQSGQFKTQLNQQQQDLVNQNQNQQQKATIQQGINDSKILEAKPITPPKPTPEQVAAEKYQQDQKKVIDDANSLISEKTTVIKPTVAEEFETKMTGILGALGITDTNEDGRVNMGDLSSTSKTTKIDLEQIYDDHINSEAYKTSKQALTAKKLELDKLDIEKRNVENNVRARYAGKGETESYILAQAQKELEALQRRSQDLAVSYDSEVATFNSMESQFNTKMDLKMKQYTLDKEAREEEKAQFDTKLKTLGFAYDIYSKEQDSSLAREKFDWDKGAEDRRIAGLTKELETKYNFTKGNINSSNQGEVDRAIEYAVSQYADPLTEGGWMFKDLGAVKSDIAKGIKDGTYKNLSDAINQRLITPTNNNEQFKSWQQSKIGPKWTGLQAGDSTYLTDGQGNLKYVGTKSKTTSASSEYSNAWTKYEVTDDAGYPAIEWRRKDGTTQSGYKKDGQYFRNDPTDGVVNMSGGYTTAPVAGVTRTDSIGGTDVSGDISVIDALKAVNDDVSSKGGSAVKIKDLKSAPTLKDITASAFSSTMTKLIPGYSNPKKITIDPNRVTLEEINPTISLAMMANGFRPAGGNTFLYTGSSSKKVNEFKIDASTKLDLSTAMSKNYNKGASQETIIKMEQKLEDFKKYIGAEGEKILNSAKSLITLTNSSDKDVQITFASIIDAATNEDQDGPNGLSSYVTRSLLNSKMWKENNGDKLAITNNRLGRLSVLLNKIATDYSDEIGLGKGTLNDFLSKNNLIAGDERSRTLKEYANLIADVGLNRTVLVAGTTFTDNLLGLLNQNVGSLSSTLPSLQENLKVMKDNNDYDFYYNIVSKINTEVYNSTIGKDPMFGKYYPNAGAAVAKKAKHQF